MNDAFYNSLDDLLIHFMKFHRDSRHWLQLRKLSTLSWGAISAEWGGFCVGGIKPPTFQMYWKYRYYDMISKNPCRFFRQKCLIILLYSNTHCVKFLRCNVPTNGWWGAKFFATIFTPSRKGFDESLSFTDSNLWLQQWKFLGWDPTRNFQVSFDGKNRSQKKATFS